MSLKYSFPTQTDELKRILGAGLPFEMDVGVSAPRADSRPYHTVITGQRRMGLIRNVDGLCHVQFALVTPEGRDRGYGSGYASIYVDGRFGGLGIGKMMVRNSFSFFSQNGDSTLETNTHANGGSFWQNLGWTASKHGTEFGETVMDDGQFFMGWASVMGNLKRRIYHDLHIFEDQKDKVEAALALLDKDDASSIWAFLDSGTVVDAYDFNNDGGRRAINLASHALYDMEINTQMDLASNAQLSRMHEKLDGIVCDPKVYRKRFCAVSMKHAKDLDNSRRYAWLGY